MPRIWSPPWMRKQRCPWPRMCSSTSCWSVISALSSEGCEIHRLGDPMPGQETLQLHLLDLAQGRIVQEPADEGDPDPVPDVVVVDEQDAEADEHEGEDATGIRRNQGRQAQFARGPPEDGAEHPAAIERITGDQVEQDQAHIDDREVAGQARQGLTAGDERLHRGEQHCQEEADQRPGDGDPEFGSGARRFRSDLRDATEQEQRDAADGDAATQCYDGMPHFMEQHAREEHDGGDCTHGRVQGRGQLA